MEVIHRLGVCRCIPLSDHRGRCKEEEVNLITNRGEIPLADPKHTHQHTPGRARGGVMRPQELFTPLNFTSALLTDFSLLNLTYCGD